MTKTTDELQGRIAVLIREHLEGQLTAVLASLSRTFGGLAAPRVVRREPAKSQVRRGAEDMAALEKRLYEAVCACPGETMAAISARAGETTLELKLPMIHLKKTGRIRSAGERNFTRYFPMASVKSA